MEKILCTINLGDESNINELIYFLRQQSSGDMRDINYNNKM